MFFFLAYFTLYNRLQFHLDSSAGKESTCNAGDRSSYSWFGKIRWRKDKLPTPVFLGFPSGSAGKESACNVGDLGSISGLGRSPGVRKGCPLQYSGLEISMDCIHGILQPRILEWVAFPFSRGSSQPRDRTQVSCIAGRFFTS